MVKTVLLRCNRLFNAFFFSALFTTSQSSSSLLSPCTLLFLWLPVDQRRGVKATGRGFFLLLCELLCSSVEIHGEPFTSLDSLLRDKNMDNLFFLCGLSVT